MRPSALAARLRRAVALVALATLPLAACGGESGPSGSDIAGSWTGTFTTGGGTTGTLAFTAVETNGQVSGNGTLSGGGTSLAVTMTGTLSGSNVSLTFNTAGFEPMNFTGTLGNDRITGSISGSGFSGEAVTLNRVGGSAARAALRDAGTPPPNAVSRRLADVIR